MWSYPKVSRAAVGRPRMQIPPGRRDAGVPEGRLHEVDRRPAVKTVWGCPVSVDGFRAWGLGLGHGHLPFGFIGDW